MPPTETITLTNQQARRVLLAHQGLWPPHDLHGKAGALDYIRRVGCLQFDPLDIVGRNPDLMLQARVADYRPAMLQELLYEDRKLVDGWDKNAALYPVEDWPYFQRHRDAARRHPGKSKEAVEATLPQIREEIEARGPLSSIDIDLDRKVKWSWAPTRLARATLESMYAWGELIIHHRVHTRKVYDFAHRHLPETLLAAPDPNETLAAYHDWYVRRRIGSVGLLWNRSGSAWLGMDGIKSKERTAALERLMARGEVIQVQVAGIDPPLYLRSADKPRIDEVLNSPTPSPHIAILAPLDNLLWDRRFIEELFDFSYVWEVYKPADEREYGYYVLPVLYGDRFVARFEPTFDQKTGVLSVKGWWWEPNIQPDATMEAAIITGARNFMRYLGARAIHLHDDVTEEAILQKING